ncbi:glutathione S-transferase [Acinetobacter zhairhuonensis]|uniref:glutathione S-transferase n=1 Tax=Acinetobacter sp. A7.4 TaxID=2919921 RepID=UPI001F4F46E3|nr:glutathione S-transferase [Acinetobacter sp. A7.4]MCJ8161497.1 glutathione S-transferase [Acinetobacter sp. A7.4]
MITLHHLEQSRSFRILWALEELNLSYQIKFYRRLATLAAPPELKQVHPLGKAPVLSDGEENIAESAVILEYLQEQYDTQQQFKPQDQAQQQQYRYWMHYAEGSLMPLLVMQLVMSNVPQHVPFLVKPVAKKITAGVKAAFIQPRLKDHIQFLETYLADHDYFAGTFSFADIQMSFPLQALMTRAHGNYPNIQAFLQRIAQRPAYARALSKEQAL